MRLDGDMGPNMGTTVNKIACTSNGWKLVTASHTLQLSSRSNWYICCRAACHCHPTANEQHAFPSWSQTS
ncbi:hypothetical protein E2C01_084472 [Portunus trituberculatus]|uniref:Uncharacterized protein n=1 Tax=Portunus trituberculatus TaxID=210409 RepID=A0A5B7IVE3_PORTR|nr:hypothetical protein [Portunus trituberculatus]